MKQSLFFTNTLAWVKALKTWLKALLKTPLSWGLGAFLVFLVVLNLLLFSPLVYVVALLKLMLPTRALKNQLGEWFGRCICARWVEVNNKIVRAVQQEIWCVEGVENLDFDQKYLLLSNHLSWLDIVAIQYALNNRVPYPRFVLKQGLARLPILGAAFWCLDYAFIKSYSKAVLKKKPHLKGQQYQAIRLACQRLSSKRYAMLIFPEGARRQVGVAGESRYRHLITPRSGGIAYCLNLIGHQLDAVLDISLVYLPRHLGFWDALCGKTQKIIIHVRRVEVPEALINTGEVWSKNSAQVHSVRKWLTSVWQEKDDVIEHLLQQESSIQPQANHPNG